MTHQLRAIMASQTNIFVNDTISFAWQNFKAWCINAPRQAKLKGPGDPITQPLSNL
jgi:hypothetical protein